MKKTDKHEPYCGCRICKPLNVTDPSTQDTGEWPPVKAGTAEAAPSPSTPGDKPDGAFMASPSGNK
jgi:hypothetical protein